MDLLIYILQVDSVACLCDLMNAGQEPSVLHSLNLTNVPQQKASNICFDFVNKTEQSVFSKHIRCQSNAVLTFLP